MAKAREQAPEMTRDAAEIERLREENKRLRQVTMACLGALAELEPAPRRVLPAANGGFGLGAAHGGS